MKAFFLLWAFIPFYLFSQKIEVLHSGTKTSIRGLSVVTDDVFWVSGSNGTVGLSVDGGKTMKWMKVKGFDSTDFRDIEAFSRTEAIIMGISEPAYILKTNDAGQSWKMVYENKKKGMFLDAMEWWNQQSGIVIGDPIDGKIFIARTFDEGATWQELPQNKLPVLAEGEACFASSGTNVRSFGKKEGVFITGGKKSRFFRKATITELPIIQGTESTGANSIAIDEKQKNIIIVGGDFTKPNDTTATCVISDNGKKFRQSSKTPSGYRSCVEFFAKNRAITCGLNGVDISADNGNTWTNICNEGFHVCRKAKEGKTVYLAGSNGKVGKLVN
jgi:photosystem II stability/assembly factor-like uncharacterized protein